MQFSLERMIHSQTLFLFMRMTQYLSFLFYYSAKILIQFRKYIFGLGYGRTDRHDEFIRVPLFNAFGLIIPGTITQYCHYEICK